MAIKIESQGDFDLETLFNLVDEALTSRDERVINALRSLLMIVTLTRVREDDMMAVNDRVRGPLRQIKEDMNDLTRRFYQLQEELDILKRSMATPTTNPYAQPGGLPTGPYSNPGGPYSPRWTGTGSVDPGYWATITTPPDTNESINKK